jgi:HAD superfamily hydrolase (TIGR01509 family)
MNSTNFFKELIDREYLKKNRKKILFTYKKISKQYKKFYPKINYGIYKLIKSTKIEKFIVSNNSKNYIVKVLNHHNLKKFFKKKNIFCFKAPRLQKPSPYGYLKILSEFKFKPKEVIIIEDSESGIKAAKLAKLKNIFKFSKKSVNRLSEGVVNFKNSKTILNFINKK